MKSVLIAAALVLSASMLSTGAAYADDVMASAYGNTTLVTGGMFETHTHYNADHTFTMTIPARNAELKGAWALDGANVCRTFEAPPPGLINPLCTPVAAHKVGDTWTVQTPGGPRTVTLVAGIR